MRKRLIFLTILSLLFLHQIVVQGQTINGSISGTVIDPQDAVVAGATVTVTNKGTGATRTVETNESGGFRVSGLAVGDYVVKTEKSGFAIITNDNVAVSVGLDSNLQIKLETGAVGATVDVSTTAGEVLDTTQSQVSKTVNSQQILELPGRNTLNGLALLNPGVLPNQNGRPGSGFAVNGNRTRSNNFTIDGANNNDQSLSIPRQNLPPEALQQFQIITNTFAAEFGRNAGSYVNQITRSGTNDFHGALFYTWAGNGLNALTTNQQRSFSANRAALGDRRALRNTRSVTVDNTYGFTVGGPIVKDHTFFFASVDSNDFRTTVSSAQRDALSPLARQRLQLAGRTVDPGAVSFLINNFPAANDPTNRGSITLTGTAAITCPASDPDCNVLPLQLFNRTLNGGIAYGTQFDRGLIKINTRINSNDQLSFRYLVDKSYDPGAPASLPGQELGQVLRNDSFTINDAYIITPKILNEARFTYSRRYLVPIENFGPQYSIGGVTAFNIGNANYPQNRKDDVYEITDNVSFTPSNHAFKLGYNLLIYKLQSFFAPNFRGTVAYGSFLNFLQDTNASYQRYAGDGLTNATTYENSVFIQDDWRVNQDLTLNLGMRYEYVTAPYGFFSNAKPDVNNFAPRIGAAWNPKDKFGGKLVLRGGFAISYDQVFQNILLNNSRNFPRGVNITQSNVSGQRFFAGIPAAPSPTAFTGNPNYLPLRLFSPNERIRQPMSLQGTVSLQYQIFKDYVFKAEYITTRGRNLIREIETNYGFCGVGNPLSKFGTPCNAAADVLARERIDPTRGSVLIGQGVADSSYHSGQFTLEKRFSKINLFGANLGESLFTANYTFSTFISDSEDVLGGQANRTIPADPRNPKLDRARAAFDQPHRFVINFVLRTPKVLEQYGRFLSSVASGWQLSGVGVLADGTPYSVLSANNALGITPGQVSTVELSQRVSINPNGQFPLTTTRNGAGVIANPNAYFIVNAPSSGILGELGANTFRTGGTQNLDLGVIKEFKTFGETQKIQFRAEIFNTFNRRNFTVIPANTIGDTVNALTFLNLGQTNVGGRTFNFGARYFF
jgi:outer membrane receptor protein involved in Fe transport